MEVTISMNENPTSQVSIFFYNTHLFGGIFFAEIGIEYHKDVERRKEICRRINESTYDVVGLCEVWADYYKDYIVIHCRRLYPHYCYHQTKGLLDLMGSGLLLLSRFPIEEWTFEAFKNLNGIDNATYKGVLGVVLDCNRAIEGIDTNKRLGTEEDQTSGKRQEKYGMIEKTSSKKLAKAQSKEMQKEDHEKEENDSKHVESEPMKCKKHLLRVFVTHCQSQNDEESSQNRERNWQQMASLAKKFRTDVTTGTILMGDMNTVYTETSMAEYATMKSIFEEYDTGLEHNTSKTKREKEMREANISFVATIDPINNSLAKIFESNKIQIADFILCKDLISISTQVATDWKLPDGDDCSDHYPVHATFSFLK